MNLLSPQTQARVEHLCQLFKDAGAAVRIMSTDLAHDECVLLVVPADESDEVFALRVNAQLAYDR